MGHSQVEKQKTHEKIVEIASRRLREKGLEGIGVADLMKEAGLTVGGFYKHFESRDQLVREAMQLAFGSWEAKVRAEGVDPAVRSYAWANILQLRPIFPSALMRQLISAGIIARVSAKDARLRR